eukprot:jgi/Ulvmu1/11300/UM074_0015.1
MLPSRCKPARRSPGTNCAPVRPNCAPSYACPLLQQCAALVHTLGASHETFPRIEARLDHEVELTSSHQLPPQRCTCSMREDWCEPALVKVSARHAHATHMHAYMQRLPSLQPSVGQLPETHAACTRA